MRQKNIAFGLPQSYNEAMSVNRVGNTAVLSASSQKVEQPKISDEKFMAKWAKAMGTGMDSNCVAVSTTGDVHKAKVGEILKGISSQIEETLGNGRAPVALREIAQEAKDAICKLVDSGGKDREALDKEYGATHTFLCALATSRAPDGDTKLKANFSTLEQRNLIAQAAIETVRSPEFEKMISDVMGGGNAVPHAFLDLMKDTVGSESFQKKHSFKANDHEKFDQWIEEMKTAAKGDPTSPVATAVQAIEGNAAIRAGEGTPGEKPGAPDPSAVATPAGSGGASLISDPAK